LVLSSLFKNI